MRIEIITVALMIIASGKKKQIQKADIMYIFSFFEDNDNKGDKHTIHNGNK